MLSLSRMATPAALLPVSGPVPDDADELPSVAAATGSPDMMNWYSSPFAAASGPTAIAAESAAAAAFFLVIVVSPCWIESDVK